MEPQCTWEGCENDGHHPMLDRNGNQWARLCGLHKKEFDGAVEGKVGKLIAVWVKAQGGQKAVTQRMQPQIEAAKRLAAALAATQREKAMKRR